VTHDGLPEVPGARRLHYNENTAGCSPIVHEALRALTRQDIGRYPEIDAITSRVERWFDVGPGAALVTNGLDEGIHVVAQYGARHHRETVATPDVIVVEPAFEVYAFAANIVRARLVAIPPRPDFEFPLDAVLAAITPATRVVYLTDPNNPTGLGIRAGAVESIAAAAPAAMILVDEAYADFSGRTTIGPILDRFPNVVVGRTFAKGHGLAALRIGALVAHRDTIDRLRPMQLPFSVNVAAITALHAALDDRRYLDWYVAQAAASRALIFESCRQQHLVFWPSEANFVLIRVGPAAAALTAALRARRILVRDKSTSPGCEGCIRLTAGLVDDTTAAVAAMEELLATLPR
jgi:histidinol-phosphate aminotransferase